AMRSLHSLSRRELLAAGCVCVALGLFTVVPWRVVAQGAKARKILFVSNRAGEGRYNIWAMNPDGSGQVNLTNTEAMELDPVWSPDGKRIAFAVLNREAKTADIFVMDANGGRRTQLTRAEAKSYAFAPTWSPNGQRIAYSIL